MHKVLLLLIPLALLAFAGQAFAATDTFSVSGKIVDGLWQPVEGANVTLLDTNGQEIAGAVTGADGSYYFKNVTADTDVYTVAVSYQHGNFTYASPAGGAQWVRARPESTVDPSLTQLIGYYPSHLGYVRGQAILFDNPGKKVNATVHVGSISSMETQDGSFVFGVPPGTYDVWASYDTPQGSDVSDTVSVNVTEMDDIRDAAPVTLELKRVGMAITDPLAAAIGVAIGLLCLGGLYMALRKLG